MNVVYFLQNNSYNKRTHELLYPKYRSPRVKVLQLREHQITKKPSIGVCIKQL